MRVVSRVTCPALAIALALPALAAAGVKAEERTQVQFGGLLGGFMSRFGGKEAKEGLVGTVAVSGERKLVLNEQWGQIVDLAEEKIYTLDAKKKTYEVTTFADIKKRFDEQRAKAEKEAEKARKKAEKDAKGEEAQAVPEFDFDVRVSRTGEKRTIAGHEAAQTITRVSVYPKGSSLQQSGGLGIVSEQWLAPEVPELQEIRDFDQRYALKMAEVFGFDAGGMRASADQMAALVAHYPGLTKALARLKEEGAKLQGIPLHSTFSLNLIRSAEEVAKAEKQDSEVSGISGFLAKKLMKKAAGDPTQPKQALMTTTVETLKITPAATAADVALPAGYQPK
jgi:hypothetical protein